MISVWQEKVFQGVMVQVVGFVQIVEGAVVPEPVRLVVEGDGKCFLHTSVSLL